MRVLTYGSRFLVYRGALLLTSLRRGVPLLVDRLPTASRLGGRHGEAALPADSDPMDPDRMESDSTGPARPRRRGTGSPMALRVALPASALVTLLAGGGLFLLQAGDDVVLTIDGVSREIRGADGTVGDLLAAEGVSVGPRDIVAPPATARLDDGDQVVVRYSRPVILTVDGRTGTYWTTERTVQGALRVLGIRSDNARMSVSRSAPIGREGLALNLFPPRTVHLRVAGKDRSVTSTGGTVGALLAEQEVRFDGGDTISPAVGTPLTDGLRVTVTRIDVKRVTAVRSLPVTTVRRNVSSLDKGETTVLAKGRKGVEKVVYEIVLADGEEVRRTRVSRTVIRPVVTRIVGVGTASVRAASEESSSSSSGGGGGLNWAALARCESGGNPGIVSSNGLYHGLYQFSVSTWRSVGGSGLPSNASSGEQTRRAKMLYERTGASSWPTCGSKLFS